VHTPERESEKISTALTVLARGLITFFTV